MELRPGYKKTIVGLIPKAWCVKQLGECLEGQPTYGINAPAVPYSDRLPAYLRITDITDDGHLSSDQRVSVKSEMSHSYYLSDGDIVFARTGASVGKSYRFNPNDGPLVYAGFLICVRPDAKKLLPAFAGAYVTSGAYWRWVRLMAMRSGQPGINGNEYAQMPIPVPPLPEQRAIAAALNDMDALLDALDRLMAKKRDLRQAAIQQLLSGGTRLPGFSGKWQTKRLGEMAQLSKVNINPLSTPTALFTHFSLPAFDNGEVPVVEAGASIGSNKFAITESVVLLSKLNPRIPRVWAPANIPRNSICSTEFMVLTPTPGFDREFLKYVCLSPIVSREMALHAIGTTGSHQRIQPQQAMAIEVPLPIDLSEQVAIAGVLFDMDTELATLAARRRKTKSLKQAMMQELLTGRTRLV